MNFSDIANWIEKNWDKICDICEKLFDVLMNKIA